MDENPIEVKVEEPAVVVEDVAGAASPEALNIGGPAPVEENSIPAPEGAPTEVPSEEVL